LNIIYSYVLHKEGKIKDIGEIVEDAKISIDKMAAASMTVNENNTARAVGSGNLSMLATPMMIALMERAAYIRNLKFTDSVGNRS
jgi:hypothetical protein